LDGLFTGKRAKKRWSDVKSLLRYGALLCISVGLIVAIWNGYRYWQGYSAVQPVNEISTHTEKTADYSREATKLPKLGEHMGMLIIPKLQVSIPIYHGASEQELQKGIGHYPKSAWPGEKNNVVLSGHRDTVFRQLGKVGVNDRLIIQTAEGEFVYKVRKVRIVHENDRTVIVEKPRPTLTVTTCYPFDFIGDAKQRYVLVAQLVKK
jgi:sortase A